MPTVRVVEVSKSYGTVRAVDDVSLAIDDGRLLTLLGPSGCGKTTTLRMIAGLEENDRGLILIGDRAVSDPAHGIFVPPARRQIGMVFQSYAIWPHMSVFANVAYPLEVRRRPRAETRRRVLETLRLVELDGFADRQATMLSGGQQQRVAIARALVFEPQVLLMDEPLSNLDAKLREQTRGEIHRLQRRLAITTIYVTHDQEEAMVLSDLIAVMHEGRVLQMAPPEETYSHPASRTVATFFGTPNLLDGKVREVRGDGVTALARVEGEGWDGWVAAPPGVRPGDAVTVLLRPEALQIADGPQAGDLAWRGRLRESVFRGSRRLVTVEAGPHLFTVDAPSDQPFSKDENVWVRASPARAWVLRE